jgi:hypothetical protein
VTNRFYLQKLNQNKFGVMNSGAILSMPIGPKQSAVCYDRAVYSIPNASKTPFVALTDIDDVRAVNQLQYLTAAKNIYFRRWEDAERIKSEFETLLDRRDQAVPISTVYFRDDTVEAAHAVHRNPTTGEIKNTEKVRLRKK